MACALKSQTKSSHFTCPTLCPGTSGSEKFLLRKVPPSKYMSHIKVQKTHSKTSLKRSFLKKHRQISHFAQQSEKKHLTKNEKQSADLHQKNGGYLSPVKQNLEENLSYDRLTSTKIALNEKLISLSWRKKMVESIIVQNQFGEKECHSTTTFQTIPSSPNAKNHYDFSQRLGKFEEDERKQKGSIMLKLAIKEVLSEGDEEKAQDQYSQALRSPHFSGIHTKAVHFPQSSHPQRYHTFANII